MTQLTADEARALNTCVEASLGDDLTANTEDRIDKALQSWVEPRNSDGHFETAIAWNSQTEDRRALIGYGYIGRSWRFAWNERHGQPWQSDIEKHVSEWRAEPRPWATDDALALRELWPRLFALGVGVCLTQAHPRSMAGGKFHCYSDADRHQSAVWDTPHVDTIAEAVTRAWLAVAEGK